MEDRQAEVTAPREVLPGKTYLVTRRCTQRQFLLKPSRRTNQLVRYCLAVAASKTGVELIRSPGQVAKHYAVSDFGSQASKEVGVS